MKTMTNLMTRRYLIRNAVAAMAIFMLVVLAGCDNTVVDKGGESDHWVVLTSYEVDNTTSPITYKYKMNDPWNGNRDVDFSENYPGGPGVRILAARQYQSSTGLPMVLPVPVFSQNGILEWSDDQLGTNDKGYTIGSDGCAMVCVAMLLKGYGADVTPGTLNKWLTEKVPIGYSDGDLIIWEDAAGYPGNVMTLEGKYEWPNKPPTSADLPQINAELHKGFPVVVGLKLQAGDAIYSK